MVDEHSVYKENVAAYALEALPAEDVAALEAHLRTCHSCTADLASYRRIADGFLLAFPPKAPPSSLRRRLRQQLAPGSRSGPSRWKWSFGKLALTAAMVVLVALNLVSTLQLNSLRNDLAEQDARSTSEQTAIAMLAYPGTQVVSFDENGVAGSLMVDKQRNLLAIFAWHLPPAPASKAYQIWLIDPQGNRTSAGFLFPEAGYAFTMSVIQSPVPLSGFTSLGVTLEPAGGSRSPTGNRIFGVGF